MTDDLAPLPPRAPLPDNADPIADPPSVAAAPGRLQGASWMTVKTRQAQRMAYGRKGGAGRPPIIGLFRFGPMTTHLWRRAEADDPYADWTLLRIEEGFQEGRNRLKQISERMHALLNSVQGFRFEVADTNRPVELPLNFTNAYGYHAAQLVHEFDETMRRIISVRHTGLLVRDEADRTEYLAGNAVRGVLEIPADWIDRTLLGTHKPGLPMLAGCTRADVRNATEAAALMCKRLGELPSDIAEGTTRPKLAPAVRLRRAGFAYRNSGVARRREFERPAEAAETQEGAGEDA